MDYFGILERSFAIARRYRVLWVFGFLLALFGAGGGFGNSFQYTASGDQFPPDQFGIPPDVGILLILIVAMFVIALVIIAFIISYMCQTALIGLVDEIEKGNNPTVRHGFNIGWSRRALRLFGVDLTIYLPVFLVLMFLVALFIVPFFVIAPAGPGDTPGLLAFILICCLVMLIPVFIAVFVGLSILQSFFHRQVVLAGDGVFDAIRNGYRLVRANLGPVIVMWLIMLVVGLLWTAVNFVLALVGLAIVGGPAALMYALSNSGLAAALVAIPFVLVALIIFAVINTLYIIFTSTVWTLIYRGLPNRPVIA
jgi:hypothetical protein